MLSATLEPRFEPEDARTVSEVASCYILTAHVLGADGPRAVTLEVSSPSGDLYQQQVETLFGAARDDQTVAFALPVAGTYVDSGGLSGVWTARLSVGGQALATRTFELLR